jgi:hypothetical protein
MPMKLMNYMLVLVSCRAALLRIVDRSGTSLLPIRQRGLVGDLLLCSDLCSYAAGSQSSRHFHLVHCDAISSLVVRSRLLSGRIGDHLSARVQWSCTGLVGANKRLYHTALLTLLSQDIHQAII